MQLSLEFALLTAAAVLAAQCHCGGSHPELWALTAVDSLARRSEPSPAVSEVLQRYRFRLLNHRVHERTPKELLARLAGELRAAEAVGDQLEDTMQALTAPQSWQPESRALDQVYSVSRCTKSAPEVALSDLSSLCNTNLDYFDVHGCLGAVVDYCNRVTVPGKRLIGTITNVANGIVSVACREGFDPVAFHAGRLWELALKYCKGVFGCNQGGADNYCRWTHGSEYTGLFYYRGDYLVYVCLKQARREWVPVSVLTELDADCIKSDMVRRYGCIKAASKFCQRFFGHAGGISVPDDLKVETYDNRRSSVELRDSFTISRSVTTASSFSHSHSLSVGTEISVKAGIPFVGESGIKVSSSYTAQFSLTKTNSRTTQYSQTSEVVVPPGHAIRKKASITHSKMDVPWRAEAVNGLGKAVTLTGTWTGVDVSDVRVTQEDL
uniref:Aerolysin-like protein n=1 Tax=Macrostomum lignano TaxID=282301 RepID=A0A1I8GJ05_9PLAT